MIAKKLTTEEFIEKAKKVHGDKYDYSNVLYINSNTKIEIICNKCGKKFLQIPYHHLSGCGCPTCKGGVRYTLDDFVKKAQKIHGNKYNYNDVIYINSDTKVKIFCNTCQKWFYQTPDHHLKGCGCNNCVINKNKTKTTLTNEEFITKARQIHGDKYDYSDVEYKRHNIKVKIYCKKCKQYFWQTPNGHTSGKGCLCCTKSHGEEIIEKWLKENNIKFETQKRFKDCKDKLALPFDFYLPDYNLCIEFQGEQHYKPRFFITLYKTRKDGINRFNLQKKHDKIKKQYCKKNNIKLIEIKHTDNIINVLVNNKL